MLGLRTIYIRKSISIKKMSSIDAHLLIMIYIILNTIPNKAVQIYEDML